MGIGRASKLWNAGAPPLWVGGVADPIETRLFTMRYHAEFGRSMSDGTSVQFGDPPEKMGFASHFSRSLKIIGTDTDRSATYDFLLVIRSNHWLISCRFRDKRRSISVKNRLFFIPRVFNAPADGVSLGTSWRRWSCKIFGWWIYQTAQTCWQYLHSFRHNTTHTTTWRMERADGQKW